MSDNGRDKNPFNFRFTAASRLKIPIFWRSLPMADRSTIETRLNSNRMSFERFIQHK